MQHRPRSGVEGGNGDPPRQQSEGEGEISPELHDVDLMKKVSRYVWDGSPDRPCVCCAAVCERQRHSGGGQSRESELSKPSR